MIIRPAQESSGEFDEQILAELIAKGCSGQDLLNKFKETRRKIGPAVKRLLSEADLAAEGDPTDAAFVYFFSTVLSIKPYFIASSGERKKSLSVSLDITSIV